MALSDCTLWVITEENLNEYFKLRPFFVLQLMQQMSGRLRALTKDYMEVQKVLAENAACEKTGSKKSSGLLEKLNFFANIWKKQNF